MGKHILSSALLVLAVVVFIWFLLLAAPGDLSWSRNGGLGGCRDCHSGSKALELKIDDVYARIAALQYRHAVVEEEKCEQCHILKGFTKTGRVWEVASLAGQREQIFFLKDMYWDRKYRLDLKVKDSAGNEVKVNPLQLIPSQVNASMDNDRNPPLISNVAVVEIRQAVFLEAVIAWDTDKSSNSIVEYGLTPRYGETAVYEKIFAKGHKITIAGLMPGKQYHYRVISRDIFGNETVSNNFVLDTSMKISDKGEGAKIIDKTLPEIKEANVFKIKGTKDIFLKLLSDKPVKAYLIVTEPAEIDKHGFGLVPERVSMIDACVKCHPQGASHPVGIRSKGLKTKIAPVLPTIEGGVITCVTCHDPHGGNKRYFMRMDSGRDLCISCHTGEPYI